VESNTGWRDYWQGQRLAACVPESPEAAAAIEAHWTAYFGQLPDAARVLDVATGNGVLALWAVRAARAAKRGLAITGVDLAAIDPPRFLQEHRAELEAVAFLGGTAAEQLPFSDGSFDVVVSQYGLEYAQLEPALAEAERVLAPGGQLHWLAHDPQSSVVAAGREQLRQIDLLLAERGPFARMEAYLRARVQQRKVARATRELTEALREAEAYCNAEAGAALLRQLCGAILDTANRLEKYHPEDVSRWLEENRRRLRGQRQRTRDLLRSCLTPARAEQVERILGGAGWSGLRSRPLELGTDGVRVGRLVSARRT
jgi:ubiquinone/menaquinone biosynthesis C-methylase UbiE